MPYMNSASVIRDDLNTFVEEAAYADSYYIGQNIMPVYPAPTKSGTYPKIQSNNGELMRKDSTLRGATGTYNEIARKFDTDTYDCVDRGLEERIDDVITRDMERFFDAEVLTSKLLSRAMMLDYEVRVAAKIFDTSTFNATNGSAIYDETNLANIDFPKDLLEAKERLTRKGVIANTLIMNDSVFNRVRRSAKLQTFLYGTIGQGTSYRLINAQDIGNSFNIPQVYVAAASYDSSKKAASTQNIQQVWSSDYVWLGYVAEGDFSALGAGRTIVWVRDSDGLFVTESYRDEKRRGDMIRVRHHTDEKIIDATCAEIINTRWA